MPPITMDRAFIDRWTRMPHSIGRLSISASSHHSLSLAAFIINTAESDFRYTQPGILSEFLLLANPANGHTSRHWKSCVRWPILKGVSSPRDPQMPPPREIELKLDVPIQ